MEKKINNLIGKAFDKEPVYGDSNKYINTKIKSYEGNVNTNLQGKKVPKKCIRKVFVTGNARFCC